MSTATPVQEHEILTYIRVEEMINKLPDDETGMRKRRDPMEMRKKTRLAKALDNMSCIPFIASPVYLAQKVPLTVGGADAGTLYDPEVDVILEKSAESSFGRGSETVLDPSYRNGCEIAAADIGLDDYIKSGLSYDVKALMFPGRKVELKLYKLAIYQDGGHFDWHMDSTHSDKHHGTLLLALNTSWEGGDLVVRRNSVETPVDLRPIMNPDGTVDSLKTVAFYTDTEHRVEPVKSGVRIVLQFDIEITKKQEGEDKTKEESDEEDAAENEAGFSDQGGEWMDRLKTRYSERQEVQAVTQAADKAALEEVISIIKEMHSSGAGEVAFALQHLYRSTSITAEYLKGSDAALYEALLKSGDSKDFEISLLPVVFLQESDWEGFMDTFKVYRYDPYGSGSDSKPPGPPPRKKQKRLVSLFHIPELSGIVEISKQHFVEHTGNEAMPAKYRYFGGGMFVCPKANSPDTVASKDD